MGTAKKMKKIAQGPVAVPHVMPAMEKIDDIRSPKCYESKRTVLRQLTALSEHAGKEYGRRF